MYPSIMSTCLNTPLMIWLYEMGDNHEIRNVQGNVEEVDVAGKWYIT